MLVAALSLLAGCYLSHERPRRSDGGREVDAFRLDAPVRDAPLRDAPPSPTCERLLIAHTTSLDGPALGSVTPRIASVGDGSVAVVYVRTDGDPTRVFLERRDRDLNPIGAPTTLAVDGFSWAEVARSGADLLVGYSLGDGSSALETVGTGPRRISVMLEHPSILFAVDESVFWGIFDMRTDNALVLNRMDRIGMLLHPPVRIELGRYGSGHHGIVHRDGRSVVLGYPREDGRGIRHGFVRTIDERGVLGPEHQIADEDITQVWPLSDEESRTLIVVSNGDSLRVERLDWDTLESLTQVTAPPIEGPFVAAMVRGHLVIARLNDSRLEADVYDEGLSVIDTLETAMPGRLGVGSSVAEVPDAMVIAAGLTRGESFPWLARIECAD